VDGRAGVCEVQVTIPASALGDAVAATLELTGSDGKKNLSNQTTIGVVRQ
jgi:hypothetical protein